MKDGWHIDRGSMGVYSRDLYRGGGRVARLYRDDAVWAWQLYDGDRRLDQPGCWGEAWPMAEARAAAEAALARRDGA